MPQSLARNHLHIVFSTKHRDPLIPRHVAGELHAYLDALCTGRRCPVLAIGGMSDHVHIALTLHRTESLADLLEEIKKSSSRWMKSRGVRGFFWQRGYGAFSFSESQRESVVRYVLSQEEHHRRRTFQEEYRTFLRLYRIEFDERYVWD